MDGLFFLIITGIVLALAYLVQAVPINIAKESLPTESTTRGDTPDDTPNQIDDSDVMAWQPDRTHTSTTKNISSEAFQSRRPLMDIEETTITKGLQSEDTASIGKPVVSTKGTASNYSMQAVEENLEIDSISEENITGDSVTVQDAERKGEENETLEETQKQAEDSTLDLVEVNSENATTIDESANETKFIVDLQEVNSNGTKGRINLPFKSITSTQYGSLVNFPTLIAGKEQNRELNNNNNSKDDLYEEESIAAYLKVEYAGAAMKKDEVFEGKSTANETITENITEQTPTKNAKLITEIGSFGAVNEDVNALDDDCLFDHQRFDVDTIGNTTSNKDLPKEKTGIEPSQVDIEKSKNTTDKPLQENPVESSTQSSTDPSAQYDLQTEEANTSEILLGNEERRLMLVILHKVVYNISQNLQEHGENASPLVSGAQSDKTSGDSNSVQAQVTEAPKDVDWNLILRALPQTFQQIVYNMEDLKNVMATQQTGDNEEDEGGKTDSSGKQ